MPVVHPVRRLYGWTVAEESRPDGTHRLVCRRGDRLMDLSAMPTLSRDQLYDQGITALLADDAYHAVMHGDRAGVRVAEEALRRHRHNVARRRIEAARAAAARERALVLAGKLRRPDPDDRDGSKLREAASRGGTNARVDAETTEITLTPAQFRRLTDRLGTGR